MIVPRPAALGDRSRDGHALPPKTLLWKDAEHEVVGVAFSTVGHATAVKLSTATLLDVLAAAGRKPTHDGRREISGDTAGQSRGDTERPQTQCRARRAFTIGSTVWCRCHHTTRISRPVLVPWSGRRPRKVDEWRTQYNEIKHYSAIGGGR